MVCPCGSSKAYEACCGVYHQGKEAPETAEQLMRSRYCAYVKADIGYLVATHDPDYLADFDRFFAAQWARSADWRGLEIHRKAKGGKPHDKGMVEFTAWFLMDGQLTCHNEVSDFRRIEGKWFYVTGAGKPANVILAARKRNSDCPCGSGLKFGKCHGA